MSTVSYVAKPADSRCRWWSVRIPAGYTLRNTFSLDDEMSMRPLGFIKKNSDLELEIGEAVIDSEAVRHVKARGYKVSIGIVTKAGLLWYSPGSATKAKIKAAATPEQWEVLKRGSGDVAACLRLLMAVEMFSPDQLQQVDVSLANALHGSGFLLEA